MPGLHEWHGTLRVGGISMKVSFTGGSATAWGVGSATFTTKDPLTQFVIENSEKYKHGLIRIERVYEEEEPEAIDHEPLAASSTIDHESLAIDHSSIEHEGAEDDAIKVADKSEAIEWLKEHYPEKGYTQRGLRSKADFDAACQECGVRFSY